MLISRTGRGRHLRLPLPAHSSCSRSGAHLEDPRRRIRHGQVPALCTGSDWRRQRPLQTRTSLGPVSPQCVAQDPAVHRQPARSAPPHHRLHHCLPQWQAGRCDDLHSLAGRLQDEFGPIVQLQRSIYGLRQSGRIWYKLLHDALTAIGFEHLNAEQGIYRATRKDGAVMFIAIYVDDLPMACSDLAWMQEVKAMLASRFKMKDLGEARRILGIEIEYDRLAGTLRPQHTVYVKSLLDRRGYKDQKTVGSPIDKSFAHLLGSKEDLLTADPLRSRELLSAAGELLFLVGTVRIDLAFAVIRLCCFAAAPTKVCWDLLDRIWRYMLSTPDLGLTYRRSTTARPLVIWTNAAWLDDKETSRSTACWMVQLFGNIVNHRVHLMDDIACSTAEAEYMAAFYSMVEGLQELRWLEQVLPELGIKVNGPTPILCDSQSAIALSKRPQYHARTKHIAWRYHLVRQWTSDGKVKPEYVATQFQLADIGTKGLTVDRFRYLCQELGFTGAGFGGECE